jgi:putative restriction endonuclease
MDHLNILGTNYEIVDTKERITIADSFVVRPNKIMTGNGEAKLYLGNDNNETRDFFGDNGFQIRCFVLKSDLIKYLEDAEAEYKNPEQPYRNKERLSILWEKRMEEVRNHHDILYFILVEQTQIIGSRVYGKSGEVPFKLIREISLPFITFASIIKLRGQGNAYIYYFRLFMDYFGEEDHPYTIKKEEQKIEQKIELSEEDKKNLSSARLGQGKYRNELLKQCTLCPITLITDDRILIASHIKPWVDSNDQEKLDPKNGFMFTPTFDFLFDRGYITFDSDKKIKISPWLSKVTCSRLNISEGKRYPLLPTEGREEYLDYHLKNIFKM